MNLSMLVIIWRDRFVASVSMKKRARSRNQRRGTCRTTIDDLAT